MPTLVHKGPATAKPIGTDTPVDVEKTIGRAAFQRLPLAVRRRFTKAADHAAPVVYDGLMETVKASRLGKIIAHLARLIGSPIVPVCGDGMVCQVTLFGYPHGTVWQRDYFWQGRRYRAATTKAVTPSGQVIEKFNRFFGMELDVYEEDGALVFSSSRFYVALFGRRFVLHYCLQPGTLKVIHRDLEDGKFQFQMRLDHKLFGEVFFQDGVFHDPVNQLGGVG